MNEFRKGVVQSLIEVKQENPDDILTKIFKNHTDIIWTFKDGILEIESSIRSYIWFPNTYRNKPVLPIISKFVKQIKCHDDTEVWIRKENIEDIEIFSGIEGKLEIAVCNLSGDFKNCLIAKHLKFTECTGFKKVTNVGNPDIIEFKDCEIAEVDLSNSVIKDGIGFDGCPLNKTLIFPKVKTYKIVIQNSKINSLKYLKSDIIADVIDFPYKDLTSFRDIDKIKDKDMFNALHEANLIRPNMSTWFNYSFDELNDMFYLIKKEAPEYKQISEIYDLISSENIDDDFLIDNFDLLFNFHNFRHKVSKRFISDVFDFITKNNNNTSNLGDLIYGFIDDNIKNVAFNGNTINVNGSIIFNTINFNSGKYYIDGETSDIKLAFVTFNSYDLLKGKYGSVEFTHCRNTVETTTIPPINAKKIVLGNCAMLDTIEVSPLVEKLVIDRCGIEKVIIPPNSNLKYLDLESTDVINLDISNATKLETLYFKCKAKDEGKFKIIGLNKEITKKVVIE